jgi:hypothetical protein
MFFIVKLNFSKSVLFFLQEQLLINQWSSFILKKYVLQFIEDIHGYFLSIALAKLSILFHMSSFHVLAFIFLAIGVEFVSQEFQVRFFLLLQLHADPYLTLSVTRVA